MKKIALFGLIITSTGCLSDTCSNYIYQRLNNNEGTYKIVKFSRDCGATTGTFIQISILPINEALPNKAGNIFIADDRLNADTTIQCLWLNDTVAQISYKTALSIYKRDAVIGRIKVIYKLY